jgi:hypothetical protein
MGQTMKLTHPLTTEQCEYIKTADVILAHDASDTQPILFYGETALKRIVESGSSENLSVVTFEINAASDDLELLAAAVLTIRGECHYRTASQN